MKTLLILVAFGCLLAVARTQLTPQCTSQLACPPDECCANVGGPYGDTCTKRKAEGKLCVPDIALKYGTRVYPVCPCAPTLTCVPNTNGRGGTCKKQSDALPGAGVLSTPGPLPGI